MIASSLETSQKKLLLQTMVMSRESDRREGILLRQGKGWFHIGSMGHEALAALALSLTPTDFLFPHYRDRALVMQRGLSVLELARGFFGKRDSSSGGRQLPSHFSDRLLNIWSMPSPTGANLLPACGTAWGMKLQGTDDAVLACVGDSGMRQGEFYEALAIAYELALPVVFVVEDNQYGISTFTGDSNPLRKGMFSKDFFIRVNARKVEEVYKVSQEALEKAREGSGPTLLWCDLDRISSHSSSDDHRLYRSADDIVKMDQLDPMEALALELMEESELAKEEWDDFKRELASKVEQDYWEAERSKDPRPNESFEQIRARPSEVEEDLFEPEDDSWRMIDTINRVFQKALEGDRKVVFFGEDIEEPMGGVFKLTEGLSGKFSDRVFNSPLAEATIMGMASGLASYGMRPVFELQFIDFVGPAWNQLVTNLSMLRWRTFGEWVCPAVIYAPYGAYLPAGGPWHSQSNEGSFAHIPGLEIVVPSTPEDAAGLMQSALNSSDPTLVLLPKHLLRRKFESKPVRTIPLGKCKILQEGDEVTVVTWGNCIEKVEEAVEKLQGAVSVEIIDLRSIVPWDKEAVMNSVKGTGRLLVVQEDSRSCSMGQLIICEISENAHLWERLIAPPKLLSREDVHIGYNPIYEYGVLPSIDQITSAISELMGGDSNAERSKTRLGAELTTNGKSHKDVSYTSPIKVPTIGEGLEEATVLKFFKQVGDFVKKDEPIYQLETDKAVVDVESPKDGVLGEWKVSENDVISIGAVIGHIQLHTALSHEKVTHTDEVRVTKPAVPVELKEIPVVELKDSSEDYDDLPLTAQQRVLANRLVRGNKLAVPATVFQDVEWAAVREARKGFKQNPETSGISSFALAAWCIVQAVKKYPTFRSSLPHQSVLRVYKNVHLGIAVSLPGDDLVTAVVENADTYGLKDFSKRMRSQVELARQGVDQARENVPLVLTSMSAFDIPRAIPVIVPPSVATLFLGTPDPKLEIKDGEVMSHEVVNLSLTIDHRVINGGGAAAFLNEVRDNLEGFEARPDIL
ncbi:MAG: thiamine pyrophosphate-dependent enzyme [Verrucomicrobiota bacterium]